MTRAYSPGTGSPEKLNNKDFTIASTGRSTSTNIIIPESSTSVEITTPEHRQSRSTVSYKPGEQVIRIKSGVKSQFKVKHTTKKIPCACCLRGPNSIPYVVQATKNDLNSNTSSRRCEDKNFKASTTDRNMKVTVIRENTGSGTLMLPRTSHGLRTRLSSNTSRAFLRSETVARESLWFSLVMLLISSVGCFLICFYIFSSTGLQKGRTYYIDVATISALVNLVMSYLGLRAIRWERLQKNSFAPDSPEKKDADTKGWLISVNVAGFFLFVSAMNFLQCCILGLMVIYWQKVSFSLEGDVVTGFACSLSFLTLFLGVLGLSAFICRKTEDDGSPVLI